MFDAHPAVPDRLATSAARPGIAEMLVQEDAGEIRLLPALPSAWPTGASPAESARWLRDRSVVESGRIERVTVRSLLGEPLRLRRRDSQRTVARTTRGSALVFVGDDLRPVYE
jgi:alpha-L-fucosidase 2